MSYANYGQRQLPGALQYVIDLFRYRHLCGNLVASSLRARFRRSRLGILWAILQPLGFAMIIAAVWGGIFQNESYLSFMVYMLSGLLVWDMTAGTALGSMGAMAGAKGYLSQARIPFFIFQVRVPLVGMVIFLFGCAGLVIALLATGQFPAPGLHLLLLPAFLCMLLVFATPLAIIFSIIGSSFRDAQYIVALAFQALFFVSPVMLGRSALLDQPHLEILRYINPFSSIIALFRSPMIFGEYWDRLDLILFGIWTGIFWVLALLAASLAGRKLIFQLGTG